MLTFRLKDYVWNPGVGAVEFFGDDDGRPVTFSISRRALAKLEAAPILGGHDGIRAYKRHLLQIQDFSREVYTRQAPREQDLVVVLSSDHLS